MSCNFFSLNMWCTYDMHVILGTKVDIDEECPSDGLFKEHQRILECKMSLNKLLEQN